MMPNKKYHPNKKNGWQAPAVPDPRVMYVPVGCQQCIECRKQKAREWQVRLLEDIKHNKNAKFITLTFTDQKYKEHYDEVQKKYKGKAPKGYSLDNEIATVAVRYFLERWRKQHKKSLRHWLITELGHNGTENIHLHGIIWPEENLHKINEIWQNGFVWDGKIERGQKVNYVNEKTVSYITKYVTKIDEKHTQYKPKILASPGIGADYTHKILHTISCLQEFVHMRKDRTWTTKYAVIKTKNYTRETHNAKQNTYKPENTNETYRTTTGHKLPLPIYLRNKIYTEEQREQLWLEKLNKETRYVMGEKIDISKGLTTLHNAITYYKEVSKKLGYGNNIADANKLEYEQQQRELQQLTRIAKAGRPR